MSDRSSELAPERVGAAAVVLLPFIALTAALAAVAGDLDDRMPHADPLVRALGGAWPTLALTLAIAAGCAWRFRPDRASLRRAGALAGAGVAIAWLVIGIERAAAGDQLPGFIPPEESARPGMALGMSAGIVEEALFRLVALPSIYALARPRVSPRVAAALAVLGTGALFALSHELTAAPFELRHFATRTLIPGVAMSAVALRLGLPFIVAAHCAAHLAIPLAFR